MATPVIMPKFGMTQEEGTIIRWLKQEGDTVAKDDVLLEVQTDKVDMEVESPAAGILRNIRFGANATVKVTTVLAMIAAPGEELASAPSATAGAPAGTPAAPAPSAERGDSRVTPVAQRLASEHGVDLRQVAGSGPAGRITKADVASTIAAAAGQAPTDFVPRPRATPAARRLARETALELNRVPGSGPAGRIQAADVARFLADLASQDHPGQQAAAGAASAAAAAESSSTHAGAAPLRGMRRTIAARLAASWQNVPHIFLTASVDMTAVEAARARLAADAPAGPAAGQAVRLTPTVFIAKAVAAALRSHPRLNAWLLSTGGELALAAQPQIDLGIAVALDDGLIVPVLRRADALGLAAIAQELASLIQRARAGTLAPADVVDGTFTISNLGRYPIDQFTAIINPPQVGILAVGQMQMQPWWTGQQFEPRPVLQITLSADHRAVDGAVAAAFLADVKHGLEDPVRLLW